MLATTELWFRYQDAQVLKGLTLDFHSMPSPDWWEPTAVGNPPYL